MSRISKSVLMVLALTLLIWNARLHACACGCQIFDLGLSDMPTTFDANRLSVQVSYMDQTQNQSGSRPAAAALNPDQRIESTFYDLEYAHQFNPDWGASIDVPYWQRSFTTDTNGTPDQVDPSPNIQTQNYQGLSDIRVMGMYTGFSHDMAGGLTFGLKLPTGAFKGTNWLMDRDTAPGTGTTDLLLGGFDRGQFNKTLGWYTQALLDAPLYERDGYQPGNNLDLTLGTHFDALAPRFGFSPLLQANITVRGHDSGGGDSLLVEQGAANFNSGYEDFYLTPGFIQSLGSHLQATVLLYLPVARNVNGDQLVASWLTSATISYLF